VNIMLARGRWVCIWVCSKRYKGTKLYSVYSRVVIVGVQTGTSRIVADGYKQISWLVRVHSIHQVKVGVQTNTAKIIGN
jgi:hypothetical protein